MNFPDFHFYCLYKCTLLGKIDFCILDFLMSSHFPTHKIGNCKIFLSANIIYPSSEVAQSCPILCDPMDCSLPGSSVHGIFQERVLEWVVISFSRGSSQPMDRTQGSNPHPLHLLHWQANSLPLAPPGKSPQS